MLQRDPLARPRRPRLPLRGLLLAAQLQYNLDVVWLPFQHILPSLDGNPSADQTPQPGRIRLRQYLRSRFVMTARRVDAAEDHFVGEHHVLVERVDVDLD